MDDQTFNRFRPFWCPFDGKRLDVGVRNSHAADASMFCDDGHRFRVALGMDSEMTLIYQVTVQLK